MKMKKWVFSVWGNSLFNSYKIPYIDTKRGTYFRSFQLGLGMPVPFLKLASLRIDAGISGRFPATSDSFNKYYILKEESPFEYRRQWTKENIKPRIIIGFNWENLNGVINYYESQFSYGIGLGRYF
ncbi:MAG: hypothetical protein HY920_06515 [Elusimicrobia bacterium]|nr:hypothetical protein [Elusimicrobiota bacterium]